MRSFVAKVFDPVLFGGVKEWNNISTDWISRLCSVGFVQIAAWARQNEVVHGAQTATGLWNDVLNVE